MGKPLVRSGRFHAGAYLRCGENVVVDVAEEVVFGDRCVIPDNAYLGGRRLEFGDDFFGYTWEFRRLDVGRGRRDDEFATLKVGSRCTFHDNKLDLAHSVLVGDDVGLSPEVWLYNHHYWLSALDGYPWSVAPIRINSGTIIGARSMLLPGSVVGENAVVGAMSVVTGVLEKGHVHAGNPARKLRPITPLSRHQKEDLLRAFLSGYMQACKYRGVVTSISYEYPVVRVMGCTLDVEEGTVRGEECERSDDLRDFLFRKGIRLYSQRPFRKLPVQGR